MHYFRWSDNSSGRLCWYTPHELAVPAPIRAVSSDKEAKVDKSRKLVLRSIEIIFFIVYPFLVWYVIIVIRKGYQKKREKNKMKREKNKKHRKMRKELFCVLILHFTRRLGINGMDYI